MDCSAFQAELPDLIYGELDAEARPGVEEHLRGCSACAGLTDELRAVKGALPRLDLPPLLGARIQLAARDALLEQRGPRSLRGGPLHLTAAAILGLSLVAVGFGLGVAWKREGEPGLVLPVDPERLARDPPTTPGVPPERADPGRPHAPRAPEAWQRVLHDAGRTCLDRGDATQAREFFRRAEAVHPQGSLALPSRLGAAEAALRLSRREDARELLRSVRAALAAGEVPGGAALLERVQALEQELGQ